MKTTLFEQQTNSLENVSLEQLQEKLATAEQNKEHCLETVDDFYNKEMLEVLADASQRFGSDSDAMALYINSSGDDYNAVIKNYEDFKDFKENKLKPIEQEISIIGREINRRKLKERESQYQNEILKEKESFNLAKEKLSDYLYDLLDNIYKQIPKEAAESGMNTQIALETYLPESVSKVRIIEECIAKIDRAAIPYDLTNLKRYMDGWDFLRKIE